MIIHSDADVKALQSDLNTVNVSTYHLQRMHSGMLSLL